MKIKLPFIAIASILALSIISVIFIGPKAASEDTPGRLPWVGEDGIGDPSLYPDVIGVAYSTGKSVGTLETRLLDESDKIPVTDSNGQLVGHFGPKGYWALGEPDGDGTVTTIEEYGDPNSDLPTRIRVLND